MSLEWYGEAVKAKLARAAQIGIDQTTAACTRAAKVRLYPGHGYDTGTYSRSIQMRPSRVMPRGVVTGLWGSFDVDYALAVELGTPPHWIGSPVMIRGVGWRYIGMHPGTSPRPALRPAADQEYPKTAARIRAAFGRAA